jgi:hypothetical protein
MKRRPARTPIAMPALAPVDGPVSAFSVVAMLVLEALLIEASARSALTTVPVGSRTALGVLVATASVDSILDLVGWLMTVGIFSVDSSSAVVVGRALPRTGPPAAKVVVSAAFFVEVGFSSSSSESLTVR